MNTRILFTGVSGDHYSLTCDAVAGEDLAISVRRKDDDDTRLRTLMFVHNPHHAPAEAHLRGGGLVPEARDAFRIAVRLDFGELMLALRRANRFPMHAVHPYDDGRMKHEYELTLSIERAQRETAFALDVPGAPFLAAVPNAVCDLFFPCIFSCGSVGDFRRAWAPIASVANGAPIVAASSAREHFAAATTVQRLYRNLAEQGFS